MIDDQYPSTNKIERRGLEMPVCTEFVSLFALTLAATACSAPPDKIALYPGFTYEQMSRFEPGRKSIRRRVSAKASTSFS